MRIIKYKTIKWSSVSELDKNVQSYIEQGWQPYGNIVVEDGASTYSKLYIQVMVMYDHE